MWFKQRKPKLTRQEQLAVKPIQLVRADVNTSDDTGGAKLKVPLRSTRWAGWLFRVPDGATKTFELDAMGLLVWNSCDGKTSVQQIIHRLARRYNLNLREAEVPTLTFLHTLTKKGLIGLPVNRERNTKR